MTQRGLALRVRSEDALCDLLLRIGRLATSISESASEFADEIDEINAEEERLSVLSSTEREALIKARLGQGRFRAGVIQLWNSQCAVTGFPFPELLKASHIRPWWVSTDEERLDPHNGLLFTPNLDTAFDMGFITFDETGSLLLSEHFAPDVSHQLGIQPGMMLSKTTPKMLAYLAHHRKIHRFQPSQKPR